MNSANKPPGEAKQDYVGHCLTCKYWGGDKSAQWYDITVRGHICMNLTRGWPRDGRCFAAHNFLEIDDGQSNYEGLLFNANFGCNYYDIEDRPDEEVVK